MEHSFFLDGFLATMAARAESGTLSYLGAGNINLERPLPEDSGEILPDALAPAESSSPRCTTPTSPSSSFVSDTLAGSTPSATPITPAMDCMNEGTSSSDEDVQMVDFIPISYPHSTIFPICGSSPPPLVGTPTVPAAAAESSSHVTTPSTIVPTPRSPSVFTPTFSPPSPQPTSLATPEVHGEVEDIPSASERRNGQKHYRCRCGERYKRLCDLTKHVQRQYRIHPCPYEECEYHTKMWPTLKDLQRHLDSKHTSPERHIRCGIDGCKETKPRKDNMRDHLRRKHFKTRPELVEEKMKDIMVAHAEWIGKLGAAARASE